MNLPKIILFAFILVLGFSSQAQDLVLANEINSEWKLLKEQNGVELYISTEGCKVGPLEKPLEYIFVKVVNTTDENKDVYFQLALHFDEGCVGCDDKNESKRAINIPANSTLTGDCSFEYGELSYLIINPNYTDTRILESLELIKFKID